MTTAVNRSTVLAALPTITDVEQLTTLMGEATPTARDKVRSSLHELDRQWLAASPLCFIATADDRGRCDCSPKGDPAGFTKVLDDTTIAVPERSGNRRVDGYRNILANPQVGLNFLIPGRGDTLRINGHARLVTDGPFFDDMIVKGHRPLLVMVVEIDEVFHHCAKAFLRSRTWEPESWNPTALPRNAAISKEIARSEMPLDELENFYQAAYTEGLYPQE